MKRLILTSIIALTINGTFGMQGNDRVRDIVAVNPGIVTISPKLDIAFVAIFGKEANKDILISWLNSFLARIGDCRVIDLQSDNIERTPEEKLSTFGVTATTKEKAMISIEIHVNDIDGILSNKSLYYAARLIASKWQSKQTYPHFQSFLIIHLLDYGFFTKSNFIDVEHNDSEEDRWHKIFSMSDDRTHLPVFDEMLEIHLFELNKWIGKKDIICDTVEDIQQLMLDGWMTFLKNPSAPELYEEGAPIEFRKALDTLLDLQRDSSFMATYRDREKAYKDYSDIIYYAQWKGFREGLKQGMEMAKEKSLKMYSSELPSEISKEETQEREHYGLSPIMSRESSAAD